MLRKTARIGESALRSTFTSEVRSTKIAGLCPPLQHRATMGDERYAHEASPNCPFQTQCVVLQFFLLTPSVSITLSHLWLLVLKHKGEGRGGLPCIITTTEIHYKTNMMHTPEYTYIQVDLFLDINYGEYDTRIVCVVIFDAVKKREGKILANLCGKCESHKWHGAFKIRQNK